MSRTSFILDAQGRKFFTGLTEGVRGTRVSVAASAMGVMNDQDIIDTITDPSFQHAQDEFDDSFVDEGNQEQHSSCAGWGFATGYSKARFRDGKQDGFHGAGNYLYSLCNNNGDNGSMLNDIADALMAMGVPSVASSTPDDIYRHTTSKLDSEAAAHKGIGLHGVDTQQELNTALCRRKIVAVAVEVEGNFSNLKSSDPNVICPAFSGGGNHCIHADDIRYNTTSKRFEYRVGNNWGRAWGWRGYAWVTWASFAQTIRVHQFTQITSTAG